MYLLKELVMECFCIYACRMTNRDRLMSWSLLFVPLNILIWSSYLGIDTEVKLIYRVSQKVITLRLLHIFPLLAIPKDENLPCYLPFIYSPMHQFWSTYLNICEN